MIEKLTEEQKEEIIRELEERAQEKYKLLDSLIKNDDHIAAISTHIEWIHACMLTIVSCSIAGVLLAEDRGFAEKEKMLKQSEINVFSLLRQMFAQANKDLWKNFGAS